MRAPTEHSGGERRVVAADCNECNEALDAARKVIQAALRLAMVADNAIVNGELQHARAALRPLHAQQPGVGEGCEVNSAHGPSSQGR